MSSYVIARDYGDERVLGFADEQLPAPGPDEVLIDVRAAGVNPWDIKVYSGAVGSDPSKLPLRLGAEATGVVVAVGEHAIGDGGPVAVGDEVIACSVTGGYAEQLLTEAHNVVPRPSTLSWEQSAGLMVVGVTAVHLLHATDVRTGETVLVHGAAGGVGQMVCQLTVLRGAKVIGTASPSRHDFLRALHVEPVAYGQGLEDRVRDVAGSDIDVALDLVGTDEAIDVSLALVDDRRRIATINGFQRGAKEGLVLLGGGPGADPGKEIRSRARMELVRLADDKQLTVHVERAFKLDEVAEAHRLVRSGHTHGKVVLLP